MIHDPELLDRLSGLHPTRYEGIVFRATPIRVDPIAPSVSGGRWAPRPNRDPGVRVLYTCLVREGAIAEVAAYLAALTPPPTKGLKLHTLAVTTSKTLTLSRDDLIRLGVDFDRYGERNYEQTQKIGAAINFLGFDGLITPSARWKCDNLTIFTGNHALEEKLEALSVEEIDWRK